VYTDQARISERTRDAFGAELHVGQWETVHGDLHWENLLAPQLGLLDWELGGRGPAGTDAATLLLHSLLVPTVAKRVHATFGDLLDTDAGQTAQLAVAARLLSRIAGGDYAELTELLVALWSVSVSSPASPAATTPSSPNPCTGTSGVSVAGSLPDTQLPVEVVDEPPLTGDCQTCLRWCAQTVEQHHGAGSAASLDGKWSRRRRLSHDIGVFCSATRAARA